MTILIFDTGSETKHQTLQTMNEEMVLQADESNGINRKGKINAKSSKSLFTSVNAGRSKGHL